MNSSVSLLKGDKIFTKIPTTLKERLESTLWDLQCPRLQNKIIKELGVAIKWASHCK